jgi:hypothetical protein
MNDLQRSVKMPGRPGPSRLHPPQAGRKISICLLAAFIVSVMIVWLGFLGWGFIAMLQWLFKLH